MVARVGDLIWLKDSQACSFAKGRSELIRGLVGKARILNELVDGVSMVPGEPSVLPPNPQGLVGIDLSGAPWGAAVRHPVVWIVGRGTDSTGWMGPTDHTPLVHTASTSPTKIEVPFFLRPHATLPPGHVAPYSSLKATLRARVRTSTATLTVRAKADDGDWVTLGTASLTTTMNNFTLSTPVIFAGGGERLLTVEISTSAGTAEVESMNFDVWNKLDAG